jgi:hypothetical protein
MSTMMKFRHRMCAACVAGAVAVVLTSMPAGAQGKSSGAAAPKVSTPTPKGPVNQPKAATPNSGKPATPPGQAKQAAAATTPKPPKATPVAKGASPKPTSGIVSPGLVAKLQPLFPPGTDLNLAAAGFKNQGQFVAAAHVSENLGIPFVALKTEMVENGASLGRAIQTLRPRADATAEVNRAETQADATIEKSRR